MSDVFRIALPNSDVHRGKVDTMTLDSRYPNPKIDTLASPPHTGIVSIEWITTGIVVNGGITKLIYSFPHKYNSIPTVFASYKFDNFSNVISGTLPFQYGAIGLIIIDSDIKNINIKYYSFDIFNSTVIPPFVMQVRFYVMAEHGVSD